MENLKKNPEKIGIKGLLNEDIIKVIDFPRKEGGKEVGDLIIVAREEEKTKIFILEVTFGGERKMSADGIKLQMSRSYFSRHQNRKYFFEKHSLPLATNIEIRGMIASYRLKLAHEFPDLWDNFTLNIS